MKPYVIKNGLILGLTLVAYQLIQFMFELYTNQYLGWGIYVLIILMLIFTIRSYREEAGGGYISYGKCVGLGSLTLSVAAAISCLFYYIYVKFVDTAIIENLKDMAIVKWEEAGMSEAQIEQSLEFAEWFMAPGFMAISAFFGYMFMGGIILLIIAAFMKRDNPNPDIDTLDSGI